MDVDIRVRKVCGDGWVRRRNVWEGSRVFMFLFLM